MVSNSRRRDRSLMQMSDAQSGPPRIALVHALVDVPLLSGPAAAVRKLRDLLMPVQGS
jgi:hypothetical protein